MTRKNRAPKAALAAASLALVMLLTACGKEPLPPLDSRREEAGTMTPQPKQAAWAQGKDVTERFIETYAGRFVDGQNARRELIIRADGGYERVAGGQVGHSGSKQLPYPSFCWYRDTGKIAQVIERSDGAREAFLPSSTHLLLLGETTRTILPPDGIDGRAAAPHCSRLLDGDGRGASSVLFVESPDKDSIRIYRSGGDTARDLLGRLAPPPTPTR